VHTPVGARAAAHPYTACSLTIESDVSRQIPSRADIKFCRIMLREWLAVPSRPMSRLSRMIKDVIIRKNDTGGNLLLDPPNSNRRPCFGIVRGVTWWVNLFKALQKTLYFAGGIGCSIPPCELPKDRKGGHSEAPEFAEASGVQWPISKSIPAISFGPWAEPVCSLRV